MEAAQMAERSALEIKHGALLVRGGKVVGRGCNSDRSRLSSLPGDANMVALHSEVAALHDAQAGFYEAGRSRKKLKGCDLYVVRLNPAGRRIQGSAERDPSRLGKSKPCLRCLRALDAAGVRRVFFSTGRMCDEAVGVDHEQRSVRELLSEATMMEATAREATRELEEPLALLVE
eukprot:CAMPEP_0183351452 /NCGR_PEP_ID=MMETSP0164_2-20130417/24978_1 /TAXON_ID=221442 /ORGANISM="Coccolithus pelagicus ssp braarudi, Strain PLY182g" /LENGTH=174 /DNA_ID=CAMNT_0025523639 /DNA_START=48 /DNA_END=574 /DNA_ORIENTATION=+